MSTDCWKPEGVLVKLDEGSCSKQLVVEFKRVALNPSDITDERLLAAYRVMADIVSIHGESYLPIFERLHYEVEQLERRTGLLELARSISDQISTQRF